MVTGLENKEETKGDNGEIVELAAICLKRVRGGREEIKIKQYK